ncbi:MAG: type II secretion system F family protein, partial [Planctomycetota bacterium]|nr:type II secretion system F family protein [Planctomycetota bacterium]
MPTFAYEAMDKTGKATKGVIEAGGKDEAREKLKARGLHPTDIQQQGGGKAASAKKAAAPVRERKRTFTLGSGVRSKDLTLFTRQFST